MKNCIILFSLSCLLAISQGVFAQEEPKEDDPYKNVPPRLKKQQDDFNGGSYMFPAQKRSNWAIGLMAGGAFESSDVHATTGYGLGLNVQKALGHTFSVRGQLTGGVMTGQNYEYSKGYFSGKDQGNPWANVRDINDNYYWGGKLVSGNTRSRVYYNYRTNWYDMSIQGVANLNNINFYKEQNKFNLYVTGGVGAMIYNTMIDALDANNQIYRFDTISTKIKLDRTIFNFGSSKNSVTSILYDMRGMNGVFGVLKSSNYESLAEHHSDEEGVPLNIRLGKKLQYWDSQDKVMKTFGKTDTANGIKSRYYNWAPTVNASAGVTYRITRRLDIGIEQRIAWTNDDLLEGQRWQENGAEPLFGNKALTRDFDAYHFTAIIMNLRLGKGEESMWWVNPLAEMYGSVADTRKLVKSASEDEDNDGIPDLFDQEPDTPEGVDTDNYGRTLDSDEDGIPDHEDEQKFSPKGCEVDSRGVVKDADDDNVPDCYDIELNSKAGCFVDAKGRCIEFPKFDCTDCAFTRQKDTLVVIEKGTGPAACVLPSVHFDLDRYNVKQEFYPALYAVARYMLDNPGVRVKVSGYTDTKDDAMIQKRIDAVINFIVGNFGIDRSRFETAIGANANGVTVYTGGKGTAKNPQHAPLDYINRRVDFNCL